MRVEPHCLELVHAHIEFFARNLQQPRGVALPELAFTEVYRGGVVGMNGNPGIDRIWIRRPGHIAARCFCRRRSARKAETHDECAAAFEQIATCEIGIDLYVHRVSPAILADASWIDFMMRG